MPYQIPNSPVESTAATLLIETLMKFGRERWNIKELVVDSFTFVWMAKLLEVDDPDGRVRILPSRAPQGCCFGGGQLEMSKSASASVRVGPSFQIYGPSGLVTIREG